MSKMLYSTLLGAAALLGLPSISSARPHGTVGHVGVAHAGHVGVAHVGHAGVAHAGHVGVAHVDHTWHGGSWYGGYHYGYRPYRALGAWPYYYGSNYSPYYYGYTDPYYYSYAVPAYSYAAPDYNTVPLIEEEQEAVAPAVAAPSTATATIQVRVPPDAQLWFEGVRMNQAGDLRTFVSPPLQTGRTFTYYIRARWTNPDGQVVDQTGQVNVQAGQQLTVDFTRA